MQAIRQYYEHAPSTILIPEAMQHRRLVVILEVQDADVKPPKTGLKSLLSSMPNVGSDVDFQRPLDHGREGVTWDS